MIPFRQLNYVVAVADSGSISAAAENLSISQPAISAAIQKVEAEYQLKIFIRERPHRVVLSPVGRSFIARARRLLESAHEFDGEARNTGQTLSGTVEVGCFEPTSAFIIPMILRGLRERGLNISLQVHEADLDELNNMLTQGRVDVALTYNMHPSPGIEFETLVEAPPYVLLSKRDPLAKQASISLEQLAEPGHGGVEPAHHAAILPVAVFTIQPAPAHQASGQVLRTGAQSGRRGRGLCVVDHATGQSAGL